MTPTVVPRQRVARFAGLAVLVSLPLAVSCRDGGSAAHPDAGPVSGDSGADVRADARGNDSSGGGTGLACTLPRLTGNETHDWDVRLAAVAGIITLGGVALPDSPALASRGNVVFRERTTNDVHALAVSGAGPAAFSGRLFAGTYDVSFEAAATANLVGLPIGGKTRLASGLDLAGDQTLAYDLTLATIAGTVTADGAPLPDSPALTSRGNLVFRQPESGDVRRFSVGATGPGAFSGSLFAGTYDVSFETVSGAALVGLPTSAETRVATSLALATDQTLAYDVQVAGVSGTLTANGAVLPDSPALTTRGNVVLRETTTGDLRSFPVAATGPGAYGGPLFAGRYDVSFQAPADAGLVGLPASSTTRLATATPITGAASLSHDLSVATVAGEITAGGLPLPDSPTLTTRGNVRFVERSTGLGHTFTLGATGAGRYEGLLFAGTYDIVFAASAAPGLLGLPPNGSKRIGDAVAITGSPTLAHDLALATVSGTITAGGTALPDSPALANRGNVVFRDRDTGVAVSLPVGATGPGRFTGPLFQSSYVVTFETVNSADLVGLPAGAETLLSKLAITGDRGSLAYDVEVVAVSGRVTADGAALPDSPTLTTRGSLLLHDKLTGDVRALPLAATGPGVFSGIAFGDSYDVTFETSGNAGLVGLPPAAETSLDIGCLSDVTSTGVVSEACANDAADLTGDWTFIFRDQVSWLRWNVSLQQTGSDLRGQFVAAGGYAGQFDPGTRAGNTISLSSTQNTATCVLRIDATISDGCLIAGTGACDNGVTQSSFVGLR